MIRPVDSSYRSAKIDGEKNWERKGSYRCRDGHWNESSGDACV